MIDQKRSISRTTLPTLAARKRQIKGRRKEQERLKQARTLSLKLVDLQTEIQSLEYLGKNLSQKKGNAIKAKKINQLADKVRRELIDLGFDVEKCLAAAKEYRAATQHEAATARPARASGASIYPLGNQTRHWK